MAPTKNRGKSAMKRRGLIRRRQMRNAEMETIRAALREGESSGKPRPFDPDAFKHRLLAMQG
ncbi:type II toxin-antitoxin system ParD family antitoxin [Pseudomonas koreensis]|uniref:ribbon-helix-helix domain-containing protein n=1 Tax=Pseudomonas koreensis TaxID=198620 RepID=UPI00237C2F00|nr:type II toxin-antitoxin system ParD family antitoxin [Pseudomonas sp. YL2]